MGKHAQGRKYSPHKKPRGAKPRASTGKRILQVLGVIFLFLLVMAVIGNLVPQQDARAATTPPRPPAQQYSRVTTCTHTVVYSVEHGVLKFDTAHKISDTITCKTGG